MTPFEIIVSAGIFSVIICLGLIIWVLRQSITKPIQAAQKQAQQAVEIEVEQARAQLDSCKVEARIEPQIKTSTIKNDLNKLKELRRKN